MPRAVYKVFFLSLLEEAGSYLLAFFLRGFRFLVAALAPIFNPLLNDGECGEGLRLPERP